MGKVLKTQITIIEDRDLRLTPYLRLESNKNIILGKIMEKEPHANIEATAIERSQKAVKNLPCALDRAVMAARVIEENKGKDVKILDLRSITQLFDFFVIASGTSRRQLHKISDDIDELFQKKLNDKKRSTSGYEESLWIVLDYEDIVIHLFEPEKRDFYALEELWGKATLIPFESTSLTENNIEKINIEEK